MKFSRLLTVQSHPNWNYVRYKSLRLLIKKMVFAYHTGKLQDTELPIKHNPYGEPISYKRGDMIAPRMPNDDSDDESGDEISQTDLLSKKAKKLQKKKDGKANYGSTDDIMEEETNKGKKKSKKKNKRRDNGLKISNEDVEENDDDDDDVYDEETGPKHTEQTPLVQTMRNRRADPSVEDMSVRVDNQLNMTHNSNIKQNKNPASAPMHATRAPAIKEDDEVHLSPLPLPEDFALNVSHPTQTQTQTQPQTTTTLAQPQLHPHSTGASEPHMSLTQTLRQSMSFSSLKSLIQGSPAQQAQHREDKVMSNIRVYEQSQAEFWKMLKEDLVVVDTFYRQMVTEITINLSRIESHSLYGHRAPNAEKEDIQHSLPDEAKYGALLAAYENLCELRLYCSLNFQAFRKIVKKYDKHQVKIPTPVGQKVNINASLSAQFLREVRKSSFAIGENMRSLTTEMFQRVSRDKLLAVENLVNTKRISAEQNKSGLFSTIKPLPILIAVVLFVVTLVLPLDLVGHRAHVDLLAHTTTATATAPVHAQADVVDPVVFIVTANDTTPAPAWTQATTTVPATPPTTTTTTTTTTNTPTTMPVIPAPLTPVVPPVNQGTETLSTHKHMLFLNGQAQKCLALLLLAVCLWVTEAVPYFCVSLLVPVLVVIMGLVVDDDNKVMSPKAASQFVAGHMFSHTSFLILLGFAISACFCKAQLELRLAAWFQRKLGHSPSKFILGVMFLGWFLSMWLNNHTAPILCVSFLTPIMSEFGKNSRFNKALLLCLAFGCNMGGMTSPIASLQNILAVSALQTIGIDLSFLQFMVVTVPFSVVALVLAWLYVIKTVPPDDVSEIPQIIYDKRPLSTLHWLVLSLSSVTILMLACMSSLEPYIGGVGTVAMLFLFTVFSLNILTIMDFNSFNWHLLILIGGGAVLGQAIRSSRLLDIMAESILGLMSGSAQLMYIQILFVIVVLTSCISHTVGALILMPLIVQLGLTLEMPVEFAVSAALAINAAMALPFSSFPNLNSLLARDDSGEPYLCAMDLIKPGVPLTLITFLLIVTLGQGLIVTLMPISIAGVSV